MVTITMVRRDRTLIHVSDSNQISYERNQPKKKTIEPKLFRPQMCKNKVVLAHRTKEKGAVKAPESICGQNGSPLDQRTGYLLLG